MKIWQSFMLTILGLVSLGLSVATVVTALSNQQIQEQLQIQQLRINNGVLGPRGQQISANLLQDMGTVAMKNDKMKAILEKHGLALQTPQTQPASPSEPQTSPEPKE